MGHSHDLSSHTFHTRLLFLIVVSIRLSRLGNPQQDLPLLSQMLTMPGHPEGPIGIVPQVLANALAFVVMWDLAGRPWQGRALYVFIALLLAMPFLHFVRLHCYCRCTTDVVFSLVFFG
ncbi:MAG: hypothetical protein HC897_15170, partial [Thermoanaerobaculia bacterium]|nr:hypothetical protein [Thermoanaerobaculia bacterium]